MHIFFHFCILSVISVKTDHILMYPMPLAIVNSSLQIVRLCGLIHHVKTQFNYRFFCCCSLDRQTLPSCLTVSLSSQSDYLCVCLAEHMSGPLLGYLLDVCQASVRVSVGASVRAPVMASVWLLSGELLIYVETTLAHLLVHLSGHLSGCLLILMSGHLLI